MAKKNPDDAFAQVYRLPLDFSKGWTGPDAPEDQAGCIEWKNLWVTPAGNLTPFPGAGRVVLTPMSNEKYTASQDKRLFFLRGDDSNLILAICDCRFAVPRILAVKSIPMKDPAVQKIWDIDNGAYWDTAARPLMSTNWLDSTGSYATGRPRIHRTHAHEYPLLVPIGDRMMVFDDLSTPGVFRNGEYTVAGLRAPVNKPFVRIAMIQNAPWSAGVPSTQTGYYWGNNDTAGEQNWTVGTGHPSGASCVLNTLSYNTLTNVPFPSDVAEGYNAISITFNGKCASSDLTLARPLIFRNNMTVAGTTNVGIDEFRVHLASANADNWFTDRFGYIVFAARMLNESESIPASSLSIWARGNTTSGATPILNGNMVYSTGEFGDFQSDTRKREATVSMSNAIPTPINGKNWTWMMAKLNGFFDKNGARIYSTNSGNANDVSVKISCLGLFLTGGANLGSQTLLITPPRFGFTYSPGPFKNKIRVAISYYDPYRGIESSISPLSDELDCGSGRGRSIMVYPGGWQGYFASTDIANRNRVLIPNHKSAWGAGGLDQVARAECAAAPKIQVYVTTENSGQAPDGSAQMYLAGEVSAYEATGSLSNWTNTAQPIQRIFVGRVTPE